MSYKHISVNVNYKSKFIRLYDNNKKNDNLDKWFQEELKEGTTHVIILLHNNSTNSKLIKIIIRSNITNMLHHLQRPKI